MISTSSSECECDDYCHYNAGGYGNGTTPFYPTMGHPLIYYAQVPQPTSRRQRSREKRKYSRNCFVKAFKWYTQERGRYSESPSNQTDMNGFALWLDSKYDEFLRDGQNLYHLKVKQTAIIESARTPNTERSEPHPKGFRVKSPWRRKPHNQSKEAGDTIQKPVQSFQVILQPKDLTRPASECYQRSIGTVQSTEIPNTSKINSRSCTCLLPEKNKAEPSLHVQTSHKSKTENLANPQIDIPSNKSDSNKLKLQNISCQCFETKVVTIDAQSQYDAKYTERVATSDGQIVPKNTCQRCEKEKVIPVVPKQEKDQGRVPEISKEFKIAVPSSTVECHCFKNLTTKIDAEVQYQSRIPDRIECACASTSFIQSPKSTYTCTCESNLEEFKVENQSRFQFPITFSNEAAQTSDHSLRFEKDATHGYPLFMKIVCADKLCK